MIFIDNITGGGHSSSPSSPAPIVLRPIVLQPKSYFKTTEDKSIVFERTSRQVFLFLNLLETHFPPFFHQHLHVILIQLNTIANSELH